MSDLLRYTCECKFASVSKCVCVWKCLGHYMNVCASLGECEFLRVGARVCVCVAHSGLYSEVGRARVGV